MTQVAMECPSSAKRLSVSLGKAAPPPVYTSPYAAVVALRFADQVLPVHKFVLANCAKLSALVSAEDDINLLDISGVTGHVVVHYLYTRSYTRPVEPDTVSDAEALRRSFEIYATTKKYQLGDVHERVKADINSQSAHLEPSEVLSIVKKACPFPDAGDLWLRDYTKALLGRTYTDVASFLASDLMATNAAESTMSITEMLLRAFMSSVEESEMKKQQAKERETLNKTMGVMGEALCAERDALEEKLSIKGKLGKIDRARFAEIKEKIAALMYRDKFEPAENTDEPEA
ncbi:inhibitor of Bruton tyrosine kinase [Microdochium nivale]|nr:inhibitor of Bruton tyrosine kinase [Microdochium nivale]